MNFKLNTLVFYKAIQNNSFIAYINNDKKHYHNVLLCRNFLNLPSSEGWLTSSNTSSQIMDILMVFAANAVVLKLFPFYKSLFLRHLFTADVLLTALWGIEILRVKINKCGWKI